MSASGYANGVGANANWQQTGFPGEIGSAGKVQSGGGGYYSILDMTRAAVNPARTPSAAWPDGYLGTINSRRSDRLLRNVQSRLTQRSYQRGVHVGERIDPVSYMWNDIIDPEAGIRAEAKGLKWTAQGDTAQNIINHMGKNHLLSPDQLKDVANGVGLSTPNNQIDPVRSAKQQRLLPAWR